MLHKMIRVLVADDSAIAREVVNEGIKPHRNTRYIEVDNVDNGQSALELLKRKQVDIAFIDINMPGLNGPEVVAAMRDTKSIDCLTVAMSSDLDARAENVFKQFGAYHFLRKPFRQEDVSEVIATYMTMTTTYPILIVDDSATMRKLTRKILENSRFDFEISEADSAQSALRALASGKFKLVLTDFHMPGIDGIELAGSIRDLSSKIGIYMMSTNETSYLERSAAFVGISGFLKKPFNADDIDTVMHEFLELDTPKFGKVRDMFSFMERERKAS
ncbi:response regulator [Labrenzia sp. VG12]|uniref:response regulator n=1 Tax=Labrenzia sp. VG12 TaxID=2021862 RepID=UPI001AD8ABFB|nr:response regulator [Labrenzia sp. VG12]